MMPPQGRGTGWTADADSRCGQHIVIDGAGAGQLIDCPKCGKSIEVSYKSKPSAVTVSRPGQSTQTEGDSSPAGRFVLLLLAVCFCYVTYRALHLEITNDETELLSSIHRNRYSDLFLAVDWNSQAHFLNVLLAKPCVEFLPLNE